MTGSPPVEVTEVRVLEGPNLYFPRPAVKVTLELPGYLAADEAVLVELVSRIGLRSSRVGAPGTEQRQRFTMRVVERAVRRLATASGTTRLGVRTRRGAGPELVTSLPRRGAGRAEGEGAWPAS